MKFLIAARWFALLILGLLASICFAQSKFYWSVKPEATIVVRKPQIGANLVEITYQGGNYPRSAIEQMLNRLGKALGNDPRDLTVTSDGQVVKAEFAAQGLILDSNPKVNLAPLAVALAFGDHPIRSFSVSFVGILPDQNTTRTWFAPKDAWLVEGIYMPSLKSLDYRVKVNTNDPNEIYMPDSKHQPIDSGKPETSGRPNIFILGGIILGAIAVGILVYSALLRPRPKGR